MQAEGLGVCEPYSKRPDVLHAHFCFVSVTPHDHWGAVASVVKGKHKITGRWMLALPDAGPTPQTDLLHYMLVPTATKWRLDMRPQRTTGFVIPRDILDARKKAFTRLTEVAASPDDVFSLIWSTPSIGSMHDFQVLVDDRSESCKDLNMEDLSSLPFRRMGKFLSSHARAAQIVQQSIDRRELAVHHAGLRKGFQDWLDEAALAPCTCVQESLFYRQLKASQQWHDANAYPKNQVGSQMNKWLTGVATKNFDGREQNLYFKGPPGSGMSTFCQAILNLLPQFYIGPPCWDSSTPWSGLRKWQLVLDASEFQPTSSLNASQVLVLLERKEKGINVNVIGQVHFTLKGSEIPYALISSNQLLPVAGWKQEQFDAVEQRCLMVTLTHRLPEEARILVPGGSAVHATCRGCSGKFCQLMMAGRGSGTSNDCEAGPEYARPSTNSEPAQAEPVPQGERENSNKTQAKATGKASRKGGAANATPKGGAKKNEARIGRGAREAEGKGKRTGGDKGAGRVEDVSESALRKNLDAGTAPPPPK